MGCRLEKEELDNAIDALEKQGLTETRYIGQFISVHRVKIDLPLNSQSESSVKVSKLRI